jgi:hypothetical protein
MTSQARWHARIGEPVPLGSWCKALRRGVAGTRCASQRVRTSGCGTINVFIVDWTRDCMPRRRRQLARGLRCHGERAAGGGGSSAVEQRRSGASLPSPRGVVRCAPQPGLSALLHRAWAAAAGRGLPCSRQHAQRSVLLRRRRCRGSAAVLYSVTSDAQATAPSQLAADVAPGPAAGRAEAQRRTAGQKKTGGTPEAWERLGASREGGRREEEAFLPSCAPSFLLLLHLAALRRAAAHAGVAPRAAGRARPCGAAPRACAAQRVSARARVAWRRAPDDRRHPRSAHQKVRMPRHAPPRATRARPPRHARDARTLWRPAGAGRARAAVRHSPTPRRAREG